MEKETGSWTISSNKLFRIALTSRCVLLVKPETKFDWASSLIKAEGMETESSTNTKLLIAPYSSWTQSWSWSTCQMPSTKNLYCIVHLEPVNSTPYKMSTFLYFKQVWLCMYNTISNSYNNLKLYDTLLWRGKFAKCLVC